MFCLLILIYWLWTNFKYCNFQKSKMIQEVVMVLMILILTLKKAMEMHWYTKNWNQFIPKQQPKQIHMWNMKHSLKMHLRMWFRQMMKILAWKVFFFFLILKYFFQKNSRQVRNSFFFVLNTFRCQNWGYSSRQSSINCFLLQYRWQHHHIFLKSKHTANNQWNKK